VSESLANAPFTIMSKRRGLSLEEKRTVILGLFHESNSAWLLKARPVVAKQADSARR